METPVGIPGIPVVGETVGDIDDNLATNGSKKVGIGNGIMKVQDWDFYTTPKQLVSFSNKGI